MNYINLELNVLKTNQILYRNKRMIIEKKVGTIKLKVSKRCDTLIASFSVSIIALKY